MVLVSEWFMRISLFSSKIRKLKLIIVVYFFLFLYRQEIVSKLSKTTIFHLSKKEHKHIFFCCYLHSLFFGLFKPTILLVNFYIGWSLKKKLSISNDAHV